MRERRSLGITALLTCLAFTGSRGQEEYRNAIPAADTKPATDIAALNNFADMRLGMMIHWGPCVIKPAGVWIEKLSRIVCGNGNMLLNFIPDQDGVIGENQREIARGIGAWMAKNGEAVYQTRGGPWLNGTWGGATRKDRHIYIHITNEAPELLFLPDCGGKLVSSSSLSAENTKAEQDETGAIRITSPKDGRTASVSVVRLTMDRVVQGMVKQAVGASYPPSRKDDEPPPAEKK